MHSVRGYQETFYTHKVRCAEENTVYELGGKPFKGVHHEEAKEVTREEAEATLCSQAPLISPHWSYVSV